jgi:hypothetical protein
MSNSPTAASSGPSPPVIGSARLLTTAKAAEVLGLTPQRMRVLRMSGKGPAFTKLSDKPNAAVYYLEEEVLSWRSSLPRMRSTLGAATAPYSAAAEAVSS